MAVGWPKRVVGSILRIGADPNDSNEVVLQKALLVGVSSACILAGGFWGLAYIAIGAPAAGTIPLLYSAASLASTLLFGIVRRLAVYRFTQLALILLLPWLMMIALGGFHNSSGVIVWSALCPLGALVLLERPFHAAAWFVAFLALLFSSAFIPSPFAVTVLSAPLITFFYVMNFGSVLAIVFLMQAYFVKQKNLFQERSEMLLLNVLPKEISDILKGEQRTIADHFEQASILFADVVQFTPLSQTMTPMDLVQLLEEVFSCFDLLVEKYGLEKIKTIGDCYMVAAGVPRPRGDHAQALARLALDMQEAVGLRAFHGQHLALRIGMNSGPVVAGVIGRKKFIYDLWGDAVNTASRMETQGQTGVIQTTRATYDRIKDDFVCEPGGTVLIKGKGEMEVWRVIGEKAAAGAPLAAPRAVA